MRRFYSVSIAAIFLFVKNQVCNAHTSAFCTVTTPDYPSSVSFFQGTYHAYSGEKAPGKLHIIPPSGIKHSFEYVRSFNAIGGCDPDDRNCAIHNCNSISCGTLKHSENPNATDFRNSIMTQAYCGSIGCGKYDLNTKKCTVTGISQTSSNLQCANIDPHSIRVECYTYASGTSGSQIVRATLPHETGFCPNAQLTNGKEIRTWYTAEVRDVVSGIYKIYSTDTDYLLDPESNPMAAPCSLSATNFLHIPLTIADAALKCDSEPPSYPFVTVISENCHAGAMSGTHCAYECHTGYKPVGDLICRDGSWSDVFCTDKHVCSVTNLAQEISDDVAGVSGMGCGFNTVSNTSCKFNCIQEDGIIRWSRGEIICNTSTGEWNKFSNYQACQSLNTENASAVVPFLERYNLLDSLSTIKIFWQAGNDSDTFIPPTLRYEFNTSCLIGSQCNSSLYCPSYVGVLPPDMGHTCVGARANDEYLVSVRACNIAGCSEWSHQLSIAIPATTTTSSTQITTRNPITNVTQAKLQNATALSNTSFTSSNFTHGNHDTSSTTSSTISNFNGTTSDFPVNTTIPWTSADFNISNTTHDITTTTSSEAATSSSRSFSSTLSNVKNTTVTTALPEFTTTERASVYPNDTGTTYAPTTTTEKEESSHILKTTQTMPISSLTSSVRVRTSERYQNNIESNIGQQNILDDGIIAGIIIASIILTILIIVVSIVLRKQKVKKDATVEIDQVDPSLSDEPVPDVEKGEIKKVVSPQHSHSKPKAVEQATNSTKSLRSVKVSEISNGKNLPTVLPSETALV